MELVEDDKFAYAESQSVRSSQSQIDSGNDLMRTIEENYHRFVEIVNNSAPVDSNLEKELAKEDKKCTFLQYRIDVLHKRYYDAKEVSTTLQKSVRDQQMEIEKVGAVIYEQLQHLHAKFPPDGLSHYSDAVSVIISAGEWVKNLKDVLKHDIDECKKKTAKLEQQQHSVTLLVDRIRKLTVDKKEFEASLKWRIQSIAKPDFDSFKSLMSLLNEKFDEYQNSKRADRMRKAELEELEKKKVEVFNEYQKLNQASAESLSKCYEIYKVFRKESDEIRKEQVEFGNLYDRMMNEFNSMLTALTREIGKLDDDIRARQQDLDRLAIAKQTKMSEHRTMLSRIEQLKLDCSNAEKFITFCREQEEMSREMKGTVLQQINMLEKINAVSHSLLEELTRRTGALELEYTSSITGIEHSAETLQDKINQEQAELDCHCMNCRKLNDEIQELKAFVSSLTTSISESKNDLRLYRHKNDFLRQFREKLEAELNENREKQLAAVHEEVEKTWKGIINAHSCIFEKQLLIDSVQNDIQEYTKLELEVQQKLWAASHKSDDLQTELAQLRKTICRDYEAVESKKKLLDDLEKNSFPKNKIPVNWFKSFEKQKQEYDTLVKQRLELEKQRNQLIIEIDSQAFQESKIESAESPKLSSLKHSMFDVFKERARKRKPINLRAG